MAKPIDSGHRGVAWRYRLLIAIFALALSARVTYTLDSVRDMRHRYPAAPVTLGDGVHLFGNSGIEQRWHLKNVVAYKNGFVDLSYSRREGCS